jgi:hypothetical protein
MKEGIIIMAEKYEGNLIETKGNFKLRGKIQGLTVAKKGFGFSDVAQKGEKKAYRSLKFFVATSNDNKVIVEMFGQPRDFAYGYSKKEKKSMKLDWAKRNNKLPGDYELILPEYDLALKLSEELKDGDDIVLMGDMSFRTYENKDGKVEQQTTMNIKTIYPATEPIDFNAEGFEETATFAQDIIIREVDEDKKEEKAYVHAYTIAYGGKFFPTTLVIDTKTIDPMFLKNIKALKTYDAIRVNGLVQNRQLTEVVEENDGWGTSEKVLSKFYKALEITGADGVSLEKKKYKDEDFVVSKVEEIFNGKVDAADFSTGTKETPIGDAKLPFDL